MAGVADTSGAVDGKAGVASVHRRGLSRVDAHPNLHLGAVRPGMSGERTLRLDGGEDGALGGSERVEERVALGIDFVAVVLREGLTEQALVLGQHRGIAVAQPPDELGRALDVREHERHRAARELLCHWQGACHSCTRRVKPPAIMKGPWRLDLLRRRSAPSFPLAVPLAQLGSLQPSRQAQVVAGGFRVPTSFAFLPGGRILVAEQRGLVRVVRARPRLAAAVPGPPPPRQHVQRARPAGDRGRPAGSSRSCTPTTPSRRTPRAGRRRPACGSEPVPDPRRHRRAQQRGGRPRPPEPGRLPGRPRRAPTASRRTAAATSAEDIASRPRRYIFLVRRRLGERRLTEPERACARSSSTRSPASSSASTRRGRGLRSNPFWSGRAADNRSKVWALGYRDPFRFTLDRRAACRGRRRRLARLGGARPRACRGSNLGWPCYEGTRRAAALRALVASCQALYRRTPRRLRAPGLTRTCAAAARGDHRAARSSAAAVLLRRRTSAAGSKCSRRPGRAGPPLRSGAAGPVAIETGPGRKPLLPFARYRPAAPRSAPLVDVPA